MSKNRTVKILATPNPAAKEGYDFEMKVNGNKTEILEFNKFKDNMKKSESYHIEFLLENKGSKKDALRFSKVEDTVLWAKEVNHIDDDCPECPCYMPGVFYVNPNFQIESEKLVVVNVDPSVQDFKFAFNFLRPGQHDGPDTDYATYDPIGSNQNGGVPFIDPAIGTWAIIGTGVALIAFIAFRSLS